MTRVLLGVLLSLRVNSGIACSSLSRLKVMLSKPRLNDCSDLVAVSFIAFIVTCTF